MTQAQSRPPSARFRRPAPLADWCQRRPEIPVCAGRASMPETTSSAGTRARAIWDRASARAHGFAQGGRFRMSESADRIPHLCMSEGAYRPGHGRAERRLCARLLTRYRRLQRRIRRRALLRESGAPAWLFIAVSPGHRPVLPHRARQIRRVKRAAAGPFVHSIDGLVARRRPSVQPHRTWIAVGIGLRRWDDITLGDGEGQGERAPSRRSARQSDRWPGYRRRAGTVIMGAGSVPDLVRTRLVP